MGQHLNLTRFVFSLTELEGDMRLRGMPVGGGWLTTCCLNGDSAPGFVWRRRNALDILSGIWKNSNNKILLLLLLFKNAFLYMIILTSIMSIRETPMNHW